MNLRHSLFSWLTLAALTVLWGSAFLLTKIAVESLPSQLVVVGRLMVAALVLLPAVVLVANRPPASRRFWLFMVLIALFGSALPFALIAWGLQSVDSSLAGILMAVMPLTTLSLSHFLVPGERLTPFRVTGFVFGFVGVVAITGLEAFESLSTGAGEPLAILAVLGGAICFAVAAILARLRPPGDALTSAASTTLIATFMIAPFAIGSMPAGIQELALPSITSVVLLGVFSTALATVLYFWLVRAAGPSFVSLLNYLIPLWAVLLGVVFLNEQLEARHLLALSLILAGVLVSQLEYQWPRARETASEARSVV
jgi:drug/metabolite transporter (DMT)-like permease